MKHYDQRTTEGGTSPLAGLLDSMRDPEMEQYVAKMRRQFAKYARSPEETRRIVDEAMRDVTLTEVLNEMRSSKPW
ncbi:MAG: hypothetical protein HY675_28950 [Chloroflexi bacterium]|nr:hypothetical protein [Chloroflexota bacterium]